MFHFWDVFLTAANLTLANSLSLSKVTQLIIRDWNSRSGEPQSLHSHSLLYTGIKLHLRAKEWFRFSHLPNYVK